MKKNSKPPTPPALASASGSGAITAEIKLLLIQEPVRRAATSLRTLADECDVDDDTNAALHNMALWLESVLDESPAYCSKRDITRAKRWAAKRNRQNDEVSRPAAE